MRGDMHQVREWINAGCDPADDDAPSIAHLDELERDDLIIGITTMSDVHPRWVLTSRGWYEADRVQHQHEKFPPGSTALAARNLSRVARP